MKTIKIKDKNSIPKNFTGIVEYLDGSKEWYKEGKLHRLDGPAIESSSGEKHWYKEGNLHKIDGPAVEYPNGRKEWFKEGKYHCLDGPAIEFLDGTKYWYIEGNFYFPKKLSELIKTSIFFGKEKGQYDLEWLKFLTEKETEEFPIIPGMKEYKDFKKVFEELEGIANK
jgi:hypothetical protein